MTMCTWNGNGEHILWQFDSEWSDRGDGYRLNYSEESKRILSLYEREFEDHLSKDEYAWLIERGYIKTNGDYDGHFKSAWQIVVLASKEIQDKLLAIGERIKAKYLAEFEYWNRFLRILERSKHMNCSLYSTLTDGFWYTVS